MLLFFPFLTFLILLKEIQGKNIFFPNTNNAEELDLLASNNDNFQPIFREKRYIKENWRDEIYNSKDTSSKILRRSKREIPVVGGVLESLGISNIDDIVKTVLGLSKKVPIPVPVVSKIEYKDPEPEEEDSDSKTTEEDTTTEKTESDGTDGETTENVTVAEA